MGEQEAGDLVERLRNPAFEVHTVHRLDPGYTARDMNEAADEIERLRSALRECEEYFDQRADAELPHGCDSPIPNEEMKMLMIVREVIPSDSLTKEERG